MRRIKLFEDFSADKKYLWPDSMGWIEELYPEEICFLTLYTSIIEIEKKSSEVPLFPIVQENDTSDLVPNEYDQDEGVSNLYLYYEIPSKKQKNCSLSIECKGNGHYTEFIRGRYMEPDEGGDPILDSVDLESAYYLDSNEDIDINFIENTYSFKSDTISKKDLINMMTYAAIQMIEAEDQTRVTKPVVPPGLYEKCESIRKKYPDLVKGTDLLSRMGIFGTK